MNKNIVIIICLSLLFVLSSCSNTEKLHLTNAEAIITNDENIVGSFTPKGKEQKVIPTDLYYKFTVKNNSNKDITQIDEIKIEPNKKLVSVVKNTVGSNIYNMDESKLTWKRGFSEIPSKGKGTFTLNYTLGAEKGSNAYSPLPSKEDLEKLKENALDGTLIMLENKKEIARFKLQPDK